MLCFFFCCGWTRFDFEFGENEFSRWRTIATILRSFKERDVFFRDGALCTHTAHNVWRRSAIHGVYRCAKSAIDLISSLEGATIRFRLCSKILKEIVRSQQLAITGYRLVNWWNFENFFDLHGIAGQWEVLLRSPRNFLLLLPFLVVFSRVFKLESISVSLVEFRFRYGAL